MTLPLISHPVLAAFWMPPSASTFRAQSDWLMWFITAISIFFFALIVGLMVFFVVPYRRRPGHHEQHSPTHNTPLEILWSVIPIILVLIIFAIGYQGYLYAQTSPANSYEVRVEAQRWSWSFIYPNGYRSDTLHVPTDRPIKLSISSVDVIHSLFIPDFGIRRDAVPGRVNTIWFQATQTGAHMLYCTEYCGTGHSHMLTQVVVHPPGEFEPWLADASKDPLEELAKVKDVGPKIIESWRANPDREALLAQYPQLKTLDPKLLTHLKPMWDAGSDLYKQRCSVCHDSGIGPSFHGLWKRGAEQGLARSGSGLSTIQVNDAYITESIRDPGAFIVNGYTDRMTKFKTEDFNDLQIMCLIEFIKRQE